MLKELLSPSFILAIISIVVAASFPSLILEPVGWLLNTEIVIHKYGNAGDSTVSVCSGVASVSESISGGAVSKKITGASEDTLEKTITGDITETITSAGNISITVTAAAEYSRMVTAPTAKETITGNWDWIKSAENQLVMGACFDTYLGGKITTTGGAVLENFGGQKVSIYAGPQIVDKKIYIRKSKTKLETDETVIKSGKLGKIGYKLTMIG